MSNDVQRQLDSYYSTMLAEQDPVTPDEVATRMRSVMPVPAPSDKAPRWVPLVVAASAAVAIAAVLAVPLLVTSDETPPATNPTVVTSTTADSAPSTTVAGTQGDADALNPYGALAWERVAVPGQGMHELDGVYFSLDSSAWSGDPVSYYWWSDDGSEWTREPLPDVGVAEAAWVWGYRPGLAAVNQGNQGVWDPVWYELSFDRSGASPQLMIQPAPQAFFAALAVPPEMESVGLIPIGQSDAFERDSDEQPSVGRIDDLSVVPGAIRFVLPDDVREQLPEYDVYGECCVVDWAAGGTVRFDKDNEPVYEKVWSLDGRRLTVEVNIFLDGEATTIHTGHVVIPESLELFSSGDFNQDGDYAIEVLWRSVNGGSSYAPMQPRILLESGDTRQNGDLGSHVLAVGGRLLWYLHRDESPNGSAVHVWTSTDGVEWTMERETEHSFYPAEIVQKNGVLVVPRSDIGLLVSVDGVTWDWQLGLSGGGVTPFRDGFVRQRFPAPAVSADGEVWHVVAVPTVLPDSAQEYVVRFVGDLVVIDWWNGEGETETWIATLPDP